MRSGGSLKGPVALKENGRDEAAIASPSDSEGEFGEDRCEPIFGSVPSQVRSDPGARSEQKRVRR